MRILILTCATGGGHLRAAAALEKYIRETTTHEVIQMDFLKSIGKLLDKMIALAFKRQRDRDALTFSYDTNLLAGVTLGGAKGAKGR